MNIQLCHYQSNKLLQFMSYLKIIIDLSLSNYFSTRVAEKSF